MADTELLKQALEALEKARDSVRMKRDGSRDVAECLNQIGKAKQAIRTRLDSVQVEGRTVFPETASAEARQRLDRLVRVAREREQPASLDSVQPTGCKVCGEMHGCNHNWEQYTGEASTRKDEGSVDGGFILSPPKADSLTSPATQQPAGFADVVSSPDMPRKEYCKFCGGDHMGTSKEALACLCYTPPAKPMEEVAEALRQAKRFNRREAFADSMLGLDAYIRFSDLVKTLDHRSGE